MIAMLTHSGGGTMPPDELRIFPEIYHLHAMVWGPEAY